ALKCRRFTGFNTNESERTGRCYMQGAILLAAGLPQITYVEFVERLRACNPGFGNGNLLIALRALPREPGHISPHANVGDEVVVEEIKPSQLVFCIHLMI